MARPFRFSPPDVAPDAMLRDRVQVALAGRFDRRVTAVIGGAGFGKTTALVQAFEENRLAPLGTDRWLACEPNDGDAWHLAQGLAAAAEIEAPSSPEEVVERLCEAVGARSPGAVCLVLDDVQFLTGGEAVELLDGLIERLPRNGHLVLSGRRLPPVAITRLELIGEALVIGEAELAFDEREIAVLLGEDGAQSAHDLGGWPALVRLAGSGRASRFVDEEILRSLTEDELEVVRSLAVLGEADAETLDRLVGFDTTGVLESLPLVHRRGDRWGAHDLWAELLAPIDPARVEAIRRTASAVLLERGDAIGAVDALAALEDQIVGSGDPDLARALRTALTRADRIDPGALRRWIERWPDPAEGSDTVEDAAVPAHLLLRGLIHRLDNPGGAACQAHLRTAAERFHADGDDDAAIAALSALIYSCHVRRDVDGLLWSFGELQRYADAGIDAARPFPVLGQALVATSVADSAEVLRCTEQLFAMPLSQELRAITLWMHATALGNLGHDAVETAAECHEIGLPIPGMAMIHTGARWRAGRIRDSLAAPTQPLDGERDRFLTAVWDTSLHAALGDTATARRHLQVVVDSSASESQWQTAGSVLLPTMTVLYAAGDIEGATRVVEEFLETTPREGRGAWYRWFGIGPIFALAPSERAWFDRFVADETIGPLYRRDYELMRAFVAVEEAGDGQLAQEMDFPATAEELMPSLGLRNGATLLAAAVGVGRDDLGAVLDDLVDLVGERARSRWRELADHPIPMIADGATRIVESLPVPPVDPWRLSMLGTTELWSGDHEVEHADWRRERVRALLTYLTLHGAATREQVMAALWPDAGDASARRSLRTTLSMLHDVLEPDRRGGDAPFFVRSLGQRLTLRLAPSRLAATESEPADGLFVDVARFERLIEDGNEFERQGTPSRSIDPYLAALDLYRGDLLPDCYDDWAVFERDRLRSRAVAAGVRAAELLVATRRIDEAITAATRVLTIEPWSEAAHRALIAAHLESGDVAAARRSFETCGRVLADIGGPTDEETLALSRRLARR